MNRGSGRLLTREWYFTLLFLGLARVRDEQRFRAYGALGILGEQDTSSTA